MRERIKDIDRLRHIDECIENINNYLLDCTLEDMQANRMRYHAVVYNMMIIGEAVNMLTREFRFEHAKTPWRDIVDMRNWLIHGYITTNPAYVWNTYTTDLPILKEQINEYIDELEKIYDM